MAETNPIQFEMTTTACTLFICCFVTLRNDYTMIISLSIRKSVGEKMRYKMNNILDNLQWHHYNDQLHNPLRYNI